MVFDHGPPLRGHANRIVFPALDPDANLHLAETYYFGRRRLHPDRTRADAPERGGEGPWAHPFAAGVELAAAAERAGLDIAGIQRANEPAIRPRANLVAGLARISAMMTGCIDSGLGGLRSTCRSADALTSTPVGRQRRVPCRDPSG